MLQILAKTFKDGVIKKVCASEVSNLNRFMYIFLSAAYLLIKYFCEYWFIILTKSSITKLKRKTHKLNSYGVSSQDVEVIF